jgi:hypothetical protein
MGTRCKSIVAATFLLLIPRSSTSSVPGKNLASSGEVLALILGQHAAFEFSLDFLGCSGQRFLTYSPDSDSLRELVV